MNSSFANSSFSRRKSGVKIPFDQQIRKDSTGFDDIAEFWKVTEEVAPKSARRSSVGSSRKARRSSSGRSSNGESEVFDYDTGSEISADDGEEEEQVTDEEADVSVASAVKPNARPKSSSANKSSPRMSRSPAASNVDAGGMDFDNNGDDDGGFYDNNNEDYGDMDVVSPFAAGESPLGRASGGSRESVGSVGSPERSRRVSFGAGTKEGSDQKTPVGRGARRRSSGAASGTGTEVGTPDGGDMTTPESTPGGMSVISTPGSNDFPRGHKVNDDSYYGGSDDEEGEGGEDLVDSDEEGDDRDRSLMASARKRGLDYDSEEDDEDGGRRSRRATKGKRFAYWKNERPVYDKGQIIGVLTAEPTPKKKKSKLNGKGGGRGGGGGSRMVVVKDANLSPVSLPKDLTFGDSESLDVWDDAKDQIKNERVVCSADLLPEPASLPITAKRASNRTAVGTAAQFFSVPGIPHVMSGWLTGALVLPPEAIKDAEGVGECAQVFFVVDCQDGALEVDYADPKEDTWQDGLAQRTVLSKGDSFYIPPGNIYRLENHSKAKEASLCWTIIKPMDDEVSA